VIQYAAIGAAVTAGAAGAGFVASSDIRKYAFLSLFVPLYTRLKKEKILDHEVRGVIYGYIIANPGEHYTAIKKKLKLNNGTLTYHLYVLEREKKIKSVKAGKMRKFYPIGAPIDGIKDAVTHPTQLKIVDLISNRPGITPSEISNALKIKKQRGSYHINKLLNKNVITVKKEGRTPRYYLASQMMAVQCEHCGSRLEREYMYCPFCGKKLG
jgi:predicted transcriptional regulator